MSNVFDCGAKLHIHDYADYEPDILASVTNGYYINAYDQYRVLVSSGLRHDDIVWSSVYSFRVFRSDIDAGFYKEPSGKLAMHEGLPVNGTPTNTPSITTKGTNLNEPRPPSRHCNCEDCKFTFKDEPPVYKPPLANPGMSDTHMPAFLNDIAPNDYHAHCKDQGKPNIYAILQNFPLALQELAGVIEQGAKKYGGNTWRLIPDMEERRMGCLTRHVLKASMGEKVDAESGKHHLAHVAWNALAVLEKMLDCDKDAVQFAIVRFSTNQYAIANERYPSAPEWYDLRREELAATLSSLGIKYYRNYATDEEFPVEALTDWVS